MLLIGLCLAELAAAVPSPGAASSYIYCYYGEALAYFVGRCFMHSNQVNWRYHTHTSPFGYWLNRIFDRLEHCFGEHCSLWCGGACVDTLCACTASDGKYHLARICVPYRLSRWRELVFSKLFVLGTESALLVPFTCNWTHTKFCSRLYSWCDISDFRHTDEHAHTNNAWTLHCQVNVSAAALIILMAVIAIGGLKQSSLVNTIAMFFKFGVLLFFLIYCFLKFHPEYLTPVFPHHAKGVFKVCMPCTHATRVWHSWIQPYIWSHNLRDLYFYCHWLTLDRHIWYLVSNNKHANIHYLHGFICL